MIIGVKPVGGFWGEILPSHHFLGLRAVFQSVKAQHHIQRGRQVFAEGLVLLKGGNDRLIQQGGPGVEHARLAVGKEHLDVIVNPFQLVIVPLPNLGQGPAQIVWGLAPVKGDEVHR